MSGGCSGEQQQLREVSPCAVYIRCYAHKPYKQHSIQFACNFSCMYSPTVFVAKQKELHPEKQVNQL